MARAKDATSTWGIEPKVRRRIRSFVLEMRKVLEEDLTRQLASLGVTPERITDPPRTLDLHGKRLREAAVAVIERAVSGKTPPDEAFDLFVRESAFTFLNRMVGLRALEERETLLVEGRKETVVRQDPNLHASSLYFRVREELPEETSPREVWRSTFERAFRGISERIGLLFDPDSEFGRYLPLQPALTKVIEGLSVFEVPPQTFAEDELLGWVYQYYNAEEKAEVYAKLGKGGKLDRPEEIAAATCLYTERYMVDFLLQNTLGALWVRMHSQTKLPGLWPYYVRPPGGQPEPEDEELPERVRDITVLDPAVGSGHFLMRAFDLLAQMYEEEGIERPEDVAGLILERNLHGIDIDLRAIQISALGLYLKGCALAGPEFRPNRMNLVSADVSLPGVVPASLLDRYAAEPDIRDLMKTLWSELKAAPKLGSLLHPERKINELLTRRIGGKDTLLQQGASSEEVKFNILEGLREEFDKEAHSDDIAQRLFGTNLEKSISLVEALSRRYDVVVMNPPYAGSKNLDRGVAEVISHEYGEGKRDLYAAFILRCAEFAKASGQVGMVTQQSWMFLRSFSKLRERMLADTSVTGLAHLGPRAFEEIGGEVVNVSLYAFRARRSPEGHRWSAFRLIGPKSPSEKERLLLQAIAGKVEGIKHEPKQSDILAIPETPFAYWLRPRFFELLQADWRVSRVAEVRHGLTTGDNDRFTRCFWEVLTIGSSPRQSSATWFWYAKGGRYQKWAGLLWLVVNWGRDGSDIRGAGLPGTRLDNVGWYFRPGLTYTPMARGSLGVRELPAAVFGHKGNLVWPRSASKESVAALLNARATSYMLRAVSQGLGFEVAHLLAIPVPEEGEDLSMIGRACTALKAALIAGDPLERQFGTSPAGTPRAESLSEFSSTSIRSRDLLSSCLHSVEGLSERMVCDSYGFDEKDVRAIVDETGTPAGWYPLVASYDKLPPVPESMELPQQLYPFLSAHDRLDPSAGDVTALKDRLRALYQTAPGAKVEQEETEEEEVLGARVAIPSETFLEELSQKLRIHPISVYNLLEEMRGEEGLVSAPLMKEAVEDYVSVSLLRILGFRWPEQDAYEEEHGPVIPSELVGADGVVPLITCNEQSTAAERIRERMEYQFGEEGAQTSDKEFRTWARKDLDVWLEKEFFKLHISQFKKRPIAWHLTSEEGTFQIFVLYHRLSRETLQRIRTLYGGGLIKRLRGELERARGRGDQAAASTLAGQIEDVEDFSARLQAIEEGSEIAARIRCQWKDKEEGGRPGPYAPDIDDGVKVNIRPFQEMGLLAKKVIPKW